MSRETSTEIFYLSHPKTPPTFTKLVTLSRNILSLADVPLHPFPGAESYWILSHGLLSVPVCVVYHTYIPGLSELSLPRGLFPSLVINVRATGRNPEGCEMLIWDVGERVYTRWIFYRAQKASPLRTPAYILYV